jgi:HSP20 family protein
MQEQTNFQNIPVKVYRTHDHLTIAAPMPGLEPEDILVEVTENGQLIIHGDMRATLKDVKKVLLDEWNVGGYHRELTLPETVDAEHANVTYGNGVLVVALFLSQETQPARITLEKTGTAHGEYRGNIGGHVQD